MNAVVEYVTPELTSRTATPPRFPHFPQLDGLRGVAVLLVVIGHLLEFGITNRWLVEIGTGLAKLGVLLFLVLSGFLITGILLAEKTGKNDINLTAFYVRRVLRLAPALLLFLGACCVLISRKAITDVPGYEIAVCLLYLRNIFGRSSSLGHLWSLSLEEQFYLIWPFVMKRIRVERLLITSSIGVAAISIFRMIAIHLNLWPYYSSVFYERPWFRFDSLLIGCCTALAVFTAKPFRKQSLQAIGRISPMLVCLFLLLYGIFGERWSHEWHMTISLVASGFLLLQLVMLPGCLLARVLSSRGLKACGRISYSLYLWQQLFIVIRTPSWSLLRSFPVSVLAALACAVTSYMLIEQPALRLKRRFESVKHEPKVFNTAIYESATTCPDEVAVITGMPENCTRYV